ncbi:hypothetical protein HNR46_003493 [Haloferula luteola]|uniref:Ice-binding protein C-terminal domain-containing protein n=1 Tax=Haloferula luteola TaxID=595692 RepID=A0A840VF33_9BACT|nr:hypothetical protein [Haloferula luteola]MBB5353238.1 hypothetical protein [Haloferula luteola]
MKTRLTPAILGFVVHGSPLMAAAMETDWLDLRPGGTPSSFELMDDGGQTQAVGQWSVTTGMGLVFPGYPRDRTLEAGSWSTMLMFQDSLTGDGTVQGIDLRVAPQASMAVYEVSFELVGGAEYYLAVGGLFRDAVDATGSVVISLTDGGGSRTIAMAETAAWDDGVSSYDQALDWDAGSGTLAPALSADGNSGFAFFDLGLLNGPATLTLAVPDGYGLSAGDEISLALGVAVPEPTGWLLAAVGLASGGWRRRR